MDDDEFEMLILIENVEEAEAAAANIPRLYFQRQNPFEVLSDLNFIKHFRLNKQSFGILVNEIAPLACKSKKIWLRSQNKVNGDSCIFWTRKLSDSYWIKFFCGMSQSSVSRGIEEISNALTRPEIINRWIHFPQNLEELTQRRARFFDSTDIPSGIGVIDCTHVAIVRPSEDEHIYVNRKNYHSLNVQLVCDENLIIMNVNANFPGSAHDAYIWAQSNVSIILERVYRQEPQNNFFLLGDSGYPLLPCLLTPLRDPLPGAEERFNSHFKRIRSIIERCNGVLKNRFRCLLKHRVLHYQPAKAPKIILSCCILHNICTRNRIPQPDRDQEFFNADLGVIPENQARVQDNMAAYNDLEAGRVLRQRIVDRH